jgi:hypothetical protein
MKITPLLFDRSEMWKLFEVFYWRKIVCFILRNSGDMNIYVYSVQYTVYSVRCCSLFYEILVSQKN